MNSLNHRLDEITDHIKQLKDPISVRRLREVVSGESPKKKKHGTNNEQLPEHGDLSERVEAIEFLMWRYARNFVEPEAQKKSSKLNKITVPVHEKMENLMFLIKNSGFIQPKTIRNALQSFKNSMARLGRR